ncbi:MAG: anthranilate/aminodeoxychorismate synthase component II, partial [Candidatus Margulisiibacteriota bacterium]
MILVIDNYDSFTYNLVQYLNELGAQTQVFRNDKITLDEIKEIAPEKILVSPGPCTP